MQSIVVLGSTGSIGVNTLLLAKKYGIKVEGLAANKNTKLLNRQIKEFNPRFVAIGDSSKKNLVDHPNVFTAKEGLVKLVEQSSSDLIVNALVGYSGVMPSIAAQKLGKKLALANKESLVVAGRFLNTESIHPIDSEHFGLWYLHNDKKIAKMYITASGGALRDWELHRIETASVEEVLKHPNWSMGQKITVDSATMVNKLFEILEAKWLFDTKDIDAYIEQKSVIHALIEFIDGSTTAHFAGVDMKLPIAYALQKEIKSSVLQPLDLLQMGDIGFKAIDTKRYPLWELKEYLLQNPQMGLILNAANDLAVEQFLDKKIHFGQIAATIQKAIEKFDGFTLTTVEEIEEQNREVRNFLLTSTSYN